MNLVEIIAGILLVSAVLLSVRRSLWQYPIGIAATLTYVYVFAEARLYASVGLNLFLTLSQIYGWWFWSQGAEGAQPRIASWSWAKVAGVCVLGLSAAAGLGLALGAFTDAALPLADAAIFGLAGAARFLTDRKALQNWPVWGAANFLAAITYAERGLWPTAVLFALLCLNAFRGWRAWREEHRAYANTTPVNTAA